MTISAALGLMGFAWLATATLVRFTRDGATEFLLVPNPVWHLGLWAVVAAGVVLMVRGQPRRLLLWSWLLMAAPLMPPFTYVAYDLRWWWAGLIVAGVLGYMPGISTSLIERARGRWAPVAVALGVMAFALASSGWQPAVVLHGDEPKYLRIAENLYQGNGFDIAKKLTVDNPAAATPRVWRNLATLPHVLATEGRLLVDDARRWLGQDASMPLKSQTPSPGLFFEGKHPGTIYQVHTPGLSFVMLPAYYMDRRWTGEGIGYQGEFPDRMPAVTTMTLLLLGGFAMAVHTLLISTGTGRATALVVAAIATLVMPAGAFGFQVYPETCGAIIVALLVRWLHACHRDAWWPALGYGLLAGFLPWLHLRFSLVVFLAVIWTVVVWRKHLRAALVFTGVALSGFATLALYTYRLTGRLIPVATYGESVPLSFERVSHGVPAFFFDRTFGVLAHAPVYALAIVGVVYLWRSRPKLAALAMLMGIAIVVPAAGHGYWAAGATPGRYLVAIVPLLAMAIAAASAPVLSRRWTAGAALALVVVSLETIWQYNAYFRKDLGAFVAPSVSGWRLNLAFPDLGSSWSFGGTDWALLGGSCMVAVAILAATVRGRVTIGGVMAGGAAIVHRSMVCLVLLAAGATALSLVTGRATSEAYGVSDADARVAVLSHAAARDLRANAISTRAGVVDPIVVMGNEPGGLDIRSAVETAVGEPFRLRVRPRTTTGALLLSDVVVDLGDGTALTFPRQMGDVEVRHIFATPGVYTVRAEAVWGGTRLQTQTAITVR